MSTLFVFAVNHDLDIVHTELTRQQGNTPDLPPLAEWLSVDVALDRVELFPTSTLAPMSLTDYLEAAFGTETIAEPARLNALSGPVLLVPEAALGGDPRPGADLTLIASLQVVDPDHSQSALPDPGVGAAAQATPKPPMSQARISGMVAMATLAVIFLLTFIVVLIA